MKKWKLFMNFFCILIAIDCLMGILSSFSNNVQEITLSYKCESVGNANRILAHNGKIYIGDTVKGIVQVFDMDGNYNYGIYIPAKGGDFWMGVVEDGLCVYTIRGQERYKINNEKEIEKDSVYYASAIEFLRTLQGDLDYNATLKLFGKVELQNIMTGEEETIQLSAPIWPFSLSIYFTGLLMVVVIMLIANDGLLEKLTKRV